MCHAEDFDLDKIESRESETKEKEVAIVKKEINSEDDSNEEEEKRAFDSEVPITL